MGSNIEIEAKVLVSKEEYNQVIKNLHLDTYYKFKQTNYYIDSDEYDIKKNGFALRVREKNQEFELTLKTPLSNVSSPARYLNIIYSLRALSFKRFTKSGCAYNALISDANIKDFSQS